MSTFLLCKENDLANGQMKEYEVEQHGKILLVKDNDKFFALGAKCTHYGAPLAKGAYCNGTVRCPWHGACFNIETGDVEDFPGFDSLPTFKALGVDPDSIALKKSDYYEKLGVNVVFGAQATKIEPKKKLVHLSNGQKFAYGKVVVATGGRPRLLNVPGYCTNVKNVFYLRTPADGQLIGQQVAGKDVVIVGSSFIGMELASVVAKKGAKSLTVVSNSGLPFDQVFGAQIGQAVLKLFEDNGVKFKLSVDILKLNHNDNNEVTSLDLKSKVGGAENLSCEICIVGIGVTPSTEVFEGSGAMLDQRGYVEVDEHLGVVGLSDVYACGDIARFPLATFQHQMANVQHWQMALKHGYGAGYDEIIVHGDASQLSFVAYYLKNENLVAVATCGKDPIAARLAEYFRI
uniref:Rieske domain-containing protein n=1 Tax=Romanomermis culicivorax TaxID=13658 RepID=A0A915IHN7_ROMCU